MKKSIIIMFVMIVPMMLSAQMPKRHCGGMEQPGGRAMEAGMHEMRGIHQLDLTEKQEDQLHTLKIDFKKETVKMKADLKLANIELHELMRNDVTGSKLDKAVDKVSSIKTQLFKSRIQHHVEIRKLLTDEQKEQLKDLRKERWHDQKECKTKVGHRKSNMKKNMK